MSEANIKHNYQVWLLQAKYDIKAANDSYDDGNFEWACYQSTQAVEKCLKSVIVHAGWRPPKVHKFGILMGMANSANQLFIELKLNYRKVEAYTFISRYPFLIPGQKRSPHEFITRQDAETCIRLGTEIFEKITAFLAMNKVKKGKETLTIEGDYYFTEQEVEHRLKTVVEQIQSSNQLKVQKIVLYGGFARDKTRPKTTTMDVLVVADTELDFIQRLQHVREITRGQEPIIEPLVYTPEEFKNLLDEEGEGYLESALEEGVVLFSENKFE